MTRRLTRVQVASFRKEIYDFFEKHGRRSLPWRRTRDPYRILVSEVMLQQTQAARVAKNYVPFLKLFPTPAALACAPLREVLRAWSGLGYNRRALALRRAAERIVSEHNGKVPSSHEWLVMLPGIGHATACAIQAFAFDLPSVFVETNIRSVYIHFFFPRRWDVSDREILPLVEQTLDRRFPRSWYSALMDYGTMLKMEGNPSGRSLHRKKPARFSGSVRQARGVLLRALTLRPSTLQNLSKAAHRSIGETSLILSSLSHDGLVERKGNLFRIPE